MRGSSTQPPNPPQHPLPGESLPTASGRPPVTDWPAWMAPAVLVSGLLLAAFGGLLIDLPAAAFGVDITASHVPAGLVIADTVVQDIAFVLAAVIFAQMGGRKVRAPQFGLRAPNVGWWGTIGRIAVLIVVYLLFSWIWGAFVHAKPEKLLETLGTNEGTALLLLSAGLTCVVAPICEELLFRGFIFTALRNWLGTLPAAVITGLLFGGVHYGSAPTLDLVPLAALGFGLCLLYRYTGSLYPSIVVHSLNNSVAFASLENWTWWQGAILIASALLLIGALVLVAKRVGVISAELPPSCGAPAVVTSA
jgi:membrane protease YdiL (CAAX protease family)